MRLCALRFPRDLSDVPLLGNGRRQDPDSTASVFVTDLEPGQTATQQALFVEANLDTKPLPDGAKAVLKSVDRLAA
jgi:hypothetical protein